jgi:Ca2+-binding EF-hand superfamily protein
MMKSSGRDNREHPLLVKFRAELLKRGTAGIKSIGLYFRIMDVDNNKKIDFDEFKNGILYHNINMSKKEITELFGLFDLNGDGTLDFNEFLQTIRVVEKKNYFLYEFEFELGFFFFLFSLR